MTFFLGLSHAFLRLVRREDCVTTQGYEFTGSLNIFARAVETGSGSDCRPDSPLDSLDIACATGGSFSHRHPKLIKRALAKNENIR